MRIAYDATAIAGSPTGIGAFTLGLLDALRGQVDATTYGLTARGRQDLQSRLTNGQRFVAVPVPATVLLKAWSIFDHPRLSSFVGKVDLFHGTNFVVPPTKREAAVVTVHDLTSVRFPELCTPTTLLYPRLIQRAIKRGAFVHTPTEAVADEVRNHFDVDPAKVVAIHHGLTAATPSTEPPQIKGDYFLAVGTIEPRKDYITLLKAFDAMAEEATDCRLVIAGSMGWRSEGFESTLRACRHRDRIDVLGYVDIATRTNLMTNATALVYPSIYEGFGLPPLEAMQLGVPVIASQIDTAEEVLQKAAMLVPVGDVPSWSKALTQILDDSALRSSLVDLGREQAIKFTWNRCASEMVALYRKAIECP